MDILERRTWAEIDLDAAAKNLAAVRSRISPKAKLCCVVKADGYGHGAVPVARVFAESGADWFAVSNIFEALELRQGDIRQPVLILGYTPPEAAMALAENNISQCVYSTEYAESLSRCARASGVTVKMHVKIDTGMSRLGFCFQDINRDTAVFDEILSVCRLPGLFPEGIFTHFAVADSGPSGTMATMRQFGCFKELVETMTRAGVEFPIRHCANSGAALDYPMSHMDMVRAGIVLYGISPSGDVAHPEEGLVPVMRLKTVAAQIKEIEPGTAVSYGRTFTAKEKMRVATVPVGYADGYPRALSDRADVLIRGKRCRVLGRICMDQCMVDVTDVPEARMGDTVTLIGRDGDEEVTAAELAEKAGTIPYEIICGISKRVPRIDVGERAR